MIDQERRVLLRHHLEEGLSKAEIARRFGISRQTIYRMIRNGDLDRDPLEVRYGPQPPVATELDPYKPIITARSARQAGGAYPPAATGTVASYP